ncbi:MAG: hypothetical protein ABI725_05165 [Chloroflexota bacterium]
MTRIADNRRRFTAVACALVVLLSGCRTDAPPTAPPTRSPRPTAAPATAAPATAAPATSTARPAGTAPEPTFPPVTPASLGLATVHHTLLAAGIDLPSGTLIDVGTSFPTGIKNIFVMLAWDFAPTGTDIGIRILSGDTMLYEEVHSVVRDQTPSGDKGAYGYVISLIGRPAWPDDTYQLDTTYNSRVDETLYFSVGDEPPPPPILGVGEDSGPIPYKDPSEVLVVTREAVLRERMGEEADEVLAAAEAVGELHDLDEGGIIRSTAEEAAEFVKDLLRDGGFHYLLILGNDDAVPYFRVDNPYGDEEVDELEDWDLPADWLPSDDPYADLIEDPYVTPDVAVARIPSSEDAELLLTQLGTNTPPDGHGYAMVNQKRRGQAAAVVAAMTAGSAVEVQYSPPVEAGDFVAGNGPLSRYLYFLLHGIGVRTDAWYGDAEAWRSLDTTDNQLFTTEWSVQPDAQNRAVTLEDNPGSTGLVSVGACYGAWTLDTTSPLGPTHKTADNNLALHYLKSGARAFVGDTHLSYSWRLGLDSIPAGRTGFEMIYWQGVSAGQAPIDAFQAAKVRMSQAIDQHIANGNPLTARIAEKTLHYMVYLGRP